MRVRCGACRTQFEVAGAGRYACPVCGSVNVVRDGGAAPGAQGGEPPPPPQGMGGYQTAPGAMPGGGGAPQQQAPPPEPDPMPKIQCPECDFSFIVGKVDKVTCPMCSAEVETGMEGDNEE